MAVARQFTPQFAVLKYVNAPGTGQCAFRLFIVLVIAGQTRHGHDGEKGILLNLRFFLVAAHVRFDKDPQLAAIATLDSQRQPRAACVVVFRALAGALIDGLIL
ncbi:hypothetical protein D9M68_921030 [compost metagenome]